MALFKKLFSKSESKKNPRGFHTLKISTLTKVTADTVKMELDVPSELRTEFDFIPGQYLNFAISIDGKEERRSYSICSGREDKLAVAIKQVENGKVSNWFNNEAKAGDELLISKAQGSFTRNEDAKFIVAIAAGSGITPIVSIGKDIESAGHKMKLFFSSKTEDSIILKSELDELNNTEISYFLTQEAKDGFYPGRITKESLTTQIKAQLELLKADGFFICGPEKMIKDIVSTLEEFGVAPDKINYELFTDPIEMKPKTKETKDDFEGNAQLTVVIDGDEETFEIRQNQNVLDTAIKNGVDAPYSCKGGVCSTCKAKVTNGKVSMKLNYSLTDDEVEDGYISTCQAHAASENLTVNYDEA